MKFYKKNKPTFIYIATNCKKMVSQDQWCAQEGVVGAVHLQLKAINTKEMVDSLWRRRRPLQTAPVNIQALDVELVETSLWQYHISSNSNHINVTINE